MGAVVYPHSVVPVTANKVWMGAYSSNDYGIQVMASLDADATVALRFDPGPTLPTGTAKLRILALTVENGATAAKINPKWASCAVGELPGSISLNVEGTSTLSFPAGDQGKYQELKVTLDADTIVAGEIIVMNLVFETSGWTVAQKVTFSVSLIWE